MLFSKSPIVALIIVGTFLTIWLFSKIRKKNKRGFTRGFLFGNRTNQSSQSINDFMTFMMVQQMFNFSENNPVSDQIKISKQSENRTKRMQLIEQQKQKILKLFEE